MRQASISIALATFNGSRYLPELLASLARQTLLPRQLVVSDDGSTDNTLEILESFKESVSFEVKLIRNEQNLGIIENFAVAFSHCSGDLIAYCDQDDVWSPRKLEMMHSQFSDANIRLVIHRSEVVDESLNPVGYRIPDDRSVELGRFNFPTSHDMTYGLGHQMLFDARLYRDFHWMFYAGYHSLDDIAANYDTQFCFLAGMTGDTVIIGDVLVKFRRHNNATSDAGLTGGEEATSHGFLGKNVDEYQSQAEQFECIAQTLSGEVIPKLPAYADQLTKYAEFLTMRAKNIAARGLIYSARNPFVRLIVLAKLLLNGSYHNKIDAGFGRRAMLVDAFVAVFGLAGAKCLVRWGSSF